MNKTTTDPKITVRLEPALRALCNNPGLSLLQLSRRYNCTEAELRQWLGDFNRGSKELTPARIVEVKEQSGGLVVTRLTSSNGHSDLATMPAPVKIVATSDMKKWLEAQRVKIIGTVNSYQIEVTPPPGPELAEFQHRQSEAEPGQNQTLYCCHENP